MTHHILFSVEDDFTGPVMDGLLKTLQELGLEMIQTQQNGITLVSAVAVPADEPPAEDAEPAEKPEADEVELTVELPAEEAAAEVETAEAVAAVEDPVVDAAAVEYCNCRALDISTTEEFTVAGTDGAVSQLRVAAVDKSTPGLIGFTHAGTEYRFPAVDESNILVSVDVNGKRKRLLLTVVETNEDPSAPAGTILFGSNDSEMLVPQGE